MPYTRDPLSARFDAPARRLIAAAYDDFGEWTGYLLPPPGPKARAWMAARGISPYERDRWGELRFVRAFKRSVFWNVKWYGGTDGLRSSRNTASGGYKSNWGAPVRVAWQTGRQVIPEGQLLGSWAVRIKIVPPGGRTQEIGRAERRRWITDDGRPTVWQSNVEYGDRPWE